jgi:predicted PurR-regulated permease PerM
MNRRGRLLQTRAQRTATRTWIAGAPFRTGFFFTLGAAVAAFAVLAFWRLGDVVTWIGLAFFVAVGCEPVVTRLIGWGFRRRTAVLLVTAGVAVVAIAVAALILPTVITEARTLVAKAPTLVTDFTEQDWVRQLQRHLPGDLNLEALLAQARQAITDPVVVGRITGGAITAGVGVFSAISVTITIAVLALCLLATMPQVAAGVTSLVPARSRVLVRSLAAEIFTSTGRYVGGMLFLAALNAVLGFVAMLVTGVPFAPVIAVVVFFVALIPLVGSVLATTLTVLIGLTNSPGTAIAIGLYYLVYMQIEAYVFTPRVMGKVLAIPVTLVIIGALIGGALLGLTGALVAMPITTAVLLIVRRVIVPLQDAKRR